MSSPLRYCANCQCELLPDEGGPLCDVCEFDHVNAVWDDDWPEFDDWPEWRSK